MLAPGVPVFNLGLRGFCYFHVTVRTGERDLHSGLYGGAVLNALHALVRALDGVIPVDGELPEPLRRGVLEPSAAELADWRSLPAGAEVIGEQGAVPADAAAAADFYLRTWASPSLDVNGIEGGSPHLLKTVTPVVAHANLSIRLVPGQEPDEIREAVESLLRIAAPAGATVEVDLLASTPPVLFAHDSPAVQLAAGAFERVVGRRPLFVRSGGSLPFAAALAGRGIPFIGTGFDLPDGNVHSPNERLRVDYLPLGVAASREVLLALRALE